MPILQIFADHASIAILNAQHAATLSHRATTDPLTGLPHHRSFYESLRKEIDRCEASGGHFALLLCDVDDFKGVNDFQGHVAGDEYLQLIAEDLVLTCRPEDSAFRYGGDEFAVILRNANAGEALQWAGVIRRNLEERLNGRVDNHLLVPALSIGAALYPDHGATAEDLVAKADTAMYAAKKRGGDLVLLYQAKPWSEPKGRRASVRRYLQNVSIDLLYAIASAVDVKDRYTYKHSILVGRHAVKIAQAMGLDPQTVERVRIRWARDPRQTWRFMEAIEHPQLRSSAAEILWQARVPPVAREVEKGLSHAVPDVRAEAAGILGSIGDSATVAPLADALRDPAPLVRRRAATALGNLKEPSAVPLLVKALKDPDDGVRYEAAWSIARTLRERDGQPVDPGADVIEALREALRDEVPTVRNAAAGAFMILKPPEVVPDLRKCLSDPIAHVRMDALVALYEIQTEEAADAIVGAIESPDDALRLRTVLILTRRMDDRVRTILKHIAATDRSLKIREVATEALGADRTNP